MQNLLKSGTDVAALLGLCRELIWWSTCLACTSPVLHPRYLINQAWCHNPVHPEFGRWSQDDQKFKVILVGLGPAWATWVPVSNKQSHKQEPLQPSQNQLSVILKLLMERTKKKKEGEMKENLKHAIHEKFKRSKRVNSVQNKWSLGKVCYLKTHETHSREIR